MCHEEIISPSTRSNKQSLDDLLALAEKLNIEIKHKEFKKIFRDSTILYRIAVKANRISELDNNEAYQLDEQCKLIKHWIKTHPLGICPLPRIIEGMTPGFLFRTVDYDLQNESTAFKESWPLIPLINSALFGGNCVDNAQSYQYAGATLPSELVHVMENYFGISPNSSTTFLPLEARLFRNQQAAEDLEELKSLPIEVRIWVDLLADEIEKRFQASKSEH